MDSVAVSIDPVALERKLKASHAGINTLIDLEGPSEVAGRTVLVKELQREPVKGSIVHADFFEIDMTERLEVTVPVHPVGKAAGVEMGGLVEQALREVELSCLPSSIPDEVQVDISPLKLGEALHVSDLTAPEGTEILTDSALTVVSIVVPRAAQAALAEQESAEAAPEGEAEGGDES